ncbi:hypothetical protein [Mesorhizobium sp.]|uniref:hypothetical protein n=1 Tax=Mesorhizobium sp. TaxID=1871066 RepID=UPI000FE634B4|nr:hypothetical protein [Mesorhizobium sp.]RWN33431.1 MAG: DUF3168 domain-containing protein [Mesorhizobium sp.]
MSAVSLTIKALLAQGNVTGVTSTRVRPFPLPQGEALPAIAVAMSAEDEEYLLAGSGQYPSATVQIHCIALKASDAIELGEKVKVALRDLLYTSADSPPVRASFQKDAIDFTDFADDLSTHRRVMSFNVRWR